MYWQGALDNYSEHSGIGSLKQLKPTKNVRMNNKPQMAG